MLKRLRNLSENNRIILKNVTLAFFIKGLSLVLSLFTMPAYIRFFHDEAALGLWFTVLSLLTWVLYFDLGIGNGLRNHLARVLTGGDSAAAKRYISSAYVSVGAVCAVAAALLIPLFGFVDWNAVFGVEEAVVSRGALLTTVRIVFFGILLQLLLNLISSVLYAMQRSSVNNFLSLCTSLIMVVGVSVIPSAGNDRNIVIMAILHVLAVALPLLLATFLVFLGPRMRRMAPALRSFGRRYARDVLSLGGVFFIVQIAYMLIMNTNEFLITRFAGSAAVVEYQIYYRLFMVGGTVFSLALTPVWSAVTKGIAERNYTWVGSLYKKLLLFSAGAAVCEFLILPVLQWVVNIWLGEEAIAVNLAHGAVFALLGSLLIFNSAISAVANGMGKLGTQSIFFGIGAILKVPLSYALVLTLHSYIGVVLANVITMALYSLAQPLHLARLIQKEKEIEVK